MFPNLVAKLLPNNVRKFQKIAKFGIFAKLNAEILKNLPKGWDTKPKNRPKSKIVIHVKIIKKCKISKNFN